MIEGDIIPMTLEFRDARDCEWQTTNHGYLKQLRVLAPWNRAISETAKAAPRKRV
ncbi:MAG: hypothetical protein ACLPKW_28450 [Acetobacteraceae bacterium]|jgi:hypothetical protein